MVVRQPPESGISGLDLPAVVFLNRPFALTLDVKFARRRPRYFFEVTFAVWPCHRVDGRWEMCRTHSDDHLGVLKWNRHTDPQDFDPPKEDDVQDHPGRRRVGLRYRNLALVPARADRVLDPAGRLYRGQRAHFAILVTVTKTDDDGAVLETLQQASTVFQVELLPGERRALPGLFEVMPIIVILSAEEKGAIERLGSTALSVGRSLGRARREAQSEDPPSGWSSGSGYRYVRPPRGYLPAP